MNHKLRNLSLGALLGVVLVSIMGATSGGFPSRPRFQSVGIGIAAPTSNRLQIAAAAPSQHVMLTDTGAALDAKTTSLVSTAGFFSIVATNDVGVNNTNLFVGTRSGSTWSAVALGNATDNPTLTHNGVSLTPSIGTFTLTLATGCTTTPTSAARFARVGNLVTLTWAAFTSCTSNATTAIATGLPAAIQPAATGFGTTPTQDNSGAYVQSVTTILSTQLSWTNGATPGNAFTASGTKTIAAGSISYVLN